MSGMIRRIRVWLTSVLPVETLLREQKLLLFALLFYFCATSVSGVFLNLFLYQATVSSTGLIATNALTNVILFNLYTYIFLLVVSCCMGVFAKRIAEKSAMLTGLGIYVLLFAIVLLTGANANKYLIWLAILNAVGSAFFHVSYNKILGYSFSEQTKRLFLTIVGIFTTVAGVLTPIIAGVFIQNGKNMNGYTVAFGTGLVMLAVSVAFVLCVRLPRKKIGKRTYFAGVLINVLKERNLRLVHLAELVRGVRDGVITFLLPVLIFTISESAVAVGFYAALCSLLQIFGERHVMKTVNEENRMGLMLFAVAVMVLTTAVFSFGFGVMSICSYGIITALIGGFLYVPIVGLYHWATSRISNSAKKAMEIQSVRELFVNLGKVIGLVLALIFYKLNSLLIAVFVVNFILIVSWVLFSRVGEDVEMQPLPEGEIETEIINHVN